MFHRFLGELEGLRKGVPYDVAQNYDGKETRWKKLGLYLKNLYGLDLKDDIAKPANSHDDLTACRMRDPLSHGIPDGYLKTHHEFATWYAIKWTRRVIYAIDQLSPDFIYFDGGGSHPCCSHGTGRGLHADATPRVIAHFLEAVGEAGGGEDGHCRGRSRDGHQEPNRRRHQRSEDAPILQAHCPG